MYEIDNEHPNVNASPLLENLTLIGYFGDWQFANQSLIVSNERIFTK